MLCDDLAGWMAGLGGAGGGGAGGRLMRVGIYVFL